MTFKNKREPTLEEYGSRVEDKEIHPEVPKGIDSISAPAGLDQKLSFIGEPGLSFYASMKGTAFIPRSS